jgi:hypothetical protein
MWWKGNFRHPTLCNYLALSTDGRQGYGLLTINHCYSIRLQQEPERFAIAGIIALAVLLLNVSSSHGDTISVTQPGATDGFGSTYMLSANCTGSVCNVTLIIDSTHATNPDISAVDFKIGSSDPFSGTAAPNGNVEHVQRFAGKWWLWK